MKEVRVITDESSQSHNKSNNPTSPGPVAGTTASATISSVGRPRPLILVDSDGNQQEVFMVQEGQDGPLPPKVLGKEFT